MIYHAKVQGQEEKQYIGSAAHFKKRFYGHTNSFRNSNYKHSTTLSTYVWEKGLNPNPHIKWSIIGRATSYRKGSRQCDLCLSEKMFISENFDNPAYLNKRSELALRCRHRAKYLLIPPMTGRMRTKSSKRSWGVAGSPASSKLFNVPNLSRDICHVTRKAKQNE